jgi:hypothetical protein
VLGFARLEQGHVSLHVQPFPPAHPVLEEIVSVCAAEAATHAAGSAPLRLDPPDAAFLGDDGKNPHHHRQLSSPTL